MVYGVFIYMIFKFVILGYNNSNSEYFNNYYELLLWYIIELVIVSKEIFVKDVILDFVSFSYLFRFGDILMEFV